MKAEHASQTAEYKKLLDLRAARVQKLESQLREAAYGGMAAVGRSAAAVGNNNNSSSSSGVMVAKETSVHTAAGQALFEIHVQVNYCIF